MRRSTKKFEYAEGKYYFTIKQSPSSITLSRTSKLEAQEVFRKYLDLGKTMEWLGKWDGKKFLEATAPSKKDKVIPV